MALDASLLPRFPYHRNPVASGSVEASDAVCECCGKAHGIIYAGVIYTARQVKSVCPWCIADGSVAHKYDAVFLMQSLRTGISSAWSCRNTIIGMSSAKPLALRAIIPFLGGCIVVNQQNTSLVWSHMK
jgi:uncharacterized protein CbrC (UPF0167 family)